MIQLIGICVHVILEEILRMSIINSIADEPILRQTPLYDLFRHSPIGFVDVGSVGGVHPIIHPLARLSSCLCFEANLDAVTVGFVTRDSSFANMTVCNTAISDSDSRAEFHVTKSEVNSSLLKADEDFIKRYDANGFIVEKSVRVETSTLDTVVQNVPGSVGKTAEILKLDCQGAEYKILTGAHDVLENQCLALWCEVEFFEVYKGQKSFSDIDRLLRGKGFSLYGLYPNYISAKKLDRNRYDTDERLMWADAFYIKDPLEKPEGHDLSYRQVGILILLALSLRYFDLAVELILAEISDQKTQENLMALAKNLSRQRTRGIEKDVDQLIAQCQANPSKKYLLGRKFIDKNSTNTNVDFLSSVPQ